MIRLGRWGRRAGVAVAILLLFWLAGLAASRVSGPETLQTSVHGLALGDYRKSDPQRLAPLLHRIIQEAQRDAAAGGRSPGGSPSPTGRPQPSSTETLPSPAPSTPPPTPAPTATPTPTPTPPPVLAGAIQGFVRDAVTATGIAGARVQAGSAATQTDSSGAYRLSLPAGSYSVTASASGYASQTQSATVLPQVAVTLNFALSPTLITGRVLDSVTGLGIPNATVSLSPGGMTTAADLSGNFSFSGVNPGTYTITAAAPTYSPASQTVTAVVGQRVTVVLKLSHGI